MSHTDNKAFWIAEAARVQRRINLGWWVERWNWILLAALLMLSPAILWFRVEDEGFFQRERFLQVSGVLFAVAALAAWLLSRRYFIDQDTALVRLDDRWGLNNRLASAAAGKSDWPVAAGGPRDRALPGWRITTALFPALAAWLVASLAWFVPLPERATKLPDLVSEPQAWEQVEEWIESLDAEELIEPESLEEIAEQIENLRNQPEEDWYSHSSLEASDTLRDSLGREIQDLARDLAAIERSLEALRTFSTELSEDGRKMLLRELSEALESLEGNGLALNEALAKQLSELNPSGLGESPLKNLSPEQLQALQEKLGKGARQLGSLEGLKHPWEGAMPMAGVPGPGRGTGELQRGPGEAPIFFGDKDDLGTRRIESVSNEDLSRAAIGDVIGLGETEHEDDLTGSGMQEGGAVDSTGSGGDAVWRDALLPDEQAVLKRYFQ